VPLPRPSSLALAALVILGTACRSDQAVLRIGLAGPFGEARGRSMRRAAALAVQQINQAGGVRGRQIELVALDDSGRADRAVDVARQLTEDPSVVAVVGHLTSGATLAAAPVYGGATPVPVISPSASSPTLSGASPWIFRVCPTDLRHGAALAAWARDQLHAGRAAVFYLNDEYGRGVRDVFVAEFRERGGEIIANDPYLDDLPSFQPYLERIRRRGGMDVLVIAGTRVGAERILRTRDSMRLDVPVMAGDGVSGIEQSPIAEGMFISTPYLPDRPDSVNASFVEAYRAATGGSLPDHRGAGAYDAVHLIAAAIAAAGPNRGAIRDYLASVGHDVPAYHGVTGRIAFDKHGDVPNKTVVLGVVRNGVLRTASGS
jgi:branched-chain amino acid transport system substrate-binding protein